MRALSHHNKGEKSKMEPGPTNYQTGNYTALGSIKSVPKFSLRKASRTTEFGYVKPG